MKLSSNTDKELWVIKTEAWEIPIYCQLAENESGEWFWVITSATALWKPILYSLSSVLHPHNLIKDRDQWVIRKELLETLATKAPGVTPSYYLRKAGAEPTQKDLEFEEEEDPGHVNDELIREAWNKTRLGSLAVYKAIWAVIVRQIAARLLIDRQPVDLGWFKIHALPYRMNWKFNLFQKHPKLIHLFSYDNESRRDLMNAEGVTSDLTRTDMMATSTIEGKTIFKWHLEIETTPQWDEYMENVEMQRLTGATPNAYLKRWGTIVRESRPVINRIIGQFCRALARPAGQPIQSGASGGERLVPYIPEKGGRPARVDGFNVPLHVDHRPTATRGPEDPNNAFRKARKVRELPVFQLKPENMRNAGGDVEG